MCLDLLKYVHFMSLIKPQSVTIKQSAMRSKSAFLFIFTSYSLPPHLQRLIMISPSRIAALTLMLLCATGCQKHSTSRSYSDQEQAHFDKILGKQKPERHLRSKRGKIARSELKREPITPDVHHNGCIRASRDTAIIRGPKDQLSAHRLSDGTLLWTHEQPGAQLLSCTSRGAIIMEHAHGDGVNLLNYDSGEVLDTHQWTRPSLDSYHCGELRTFPLPGDEPGFAWQLTPFYAHGGRAPSPEAEEHKARSRCCMRGTAKIVGDALKSITHEHHTGKAYGRDGHRCDMIKPDEVGELKALDERQIGQEIGVVLDLPKDLVNPPVWTTVHGEFEPGHIMFTQYVRQDCGPSYARTGIATRGSEGTWTASWNTEGFMTSFCPIP